MLHHRKHPVHFPVFKLSTSSTVVFLTVCTKWKRKILCNEVIHKHLVKCWVQANSWGVGRYIIMPDHIHLFCSPSPNSRFSLMQWVSYWKSLSAKSWPDKVSGKVWLKDGWDTRIRNAEHYSRKWDYVKNNPVRAGLVNVTELWPYQGEINKLVWFED